MKEPDFSRIPWRKLHCDVPQELRADWALLTWQAKGLYGLLLAAVTRDGYLDLGSAGLRGVSGHLGAKGEWDSMASHLDELLGCGWVLHDQEQQRIALPAFAASQEAQTPEAIRQAAHRRRVTSRDSHVTVTGESRDNNDRIENREVREEKRELIQDPPKAPQGGQSTPHDPAAAPAPEAKPRRRKVASTQALAIATTLLGELSAARIRVDKGCEPLKPRDANLVEIAGRLDEGVSTEEIRHVIAVCEARARHSNEARGFFNAISPFRRSNIEMWIAMPLEQAQRAPPPFNRPAGGAFARAAQQQPESDEVPSVLDP